MPPGSTRAKRHPSRNGTVRRPDAAPARAGDLSGRGLLLAAQLTQRRGSRHTADGGRRTADGKTIWAEIGLLAEE
ncbi:hypothetical protein [Streptomyces sp. AC550_RSS872]|uniref:hypothetical protein n=1 Tax=Streptomyces sp. AC550_RSS872 TaxID=2823689 RepID=UPI001C259A62|nr:hypothetical protein [Streptomyces sp. AC550_RSS872]